jgi:hypothetical protein
MSFVILALSAVLVGQVTGPGWTKVYEPPTLRERIVAVWATNRDQWFVGGSWGVTRVTEASSDRWETPGIMIEGFFADDVKNVFALGTGELVLHYRGTEWVQEHAAAGLPKRSSRANDLLYSAAYLPDEGRATLVAFGPNLALRRNEDGTWTKPPEPVRSSLSSLAELGPSEGPPGCRHDAWFWLGRNVGWLSCRDRRTFTYEHGQFTPHGKVPSACKFVKRVAYAHENGYVVCAEHQLWKTVGQTWEALPVPADKDRDYFSVSVADSCVFVTTKHAVWRRCEP